mmetsp:Transcript_31364/g.43517  ORF Transcript_31364/g.43517 Transcript_31364/m.43517 type:complete len:432 (-) Transcript_31364:283-1578(-)|eukprot:CAMPEP_0196592554 /NCGR_PEP_ID=MMETSP1081-20130531/73062_1 /TAXON_ID=36882 /ORGANISM="Pyramimonas amylifera, Strain CCMP720" /LENGTH=431 /DNA_ID=CAMNT_0041916281 /DNA_START=191 /DNA_END=1486 /DNA_ORIENTATION=-
MPVRKRTNSVGSGSVLVEIGNTYERLGNRDAPLSRNGIKKVHQWELFLRVIEGDQAVIQKVEFVLDPSFNPQKYIKTLAPFHTKQTSYGAFTANVQIYLGNKVETVPHRLAFIKGGSSNRYELAIPNGALEVPVKAIPLPHRHFGIELELTIDNSWSLQMVANALSSKGVGCEVSYVHNGNPTNWWRIVPDGSIVCNPGRACNTFELVSPKLCGGEGLQQVHKVLQLLSQCPLRVNRSAGFHVHISVEGLNFMQMKKICQNFVKYEGAFDIVVPNSRRDNQYCQSNRFNARLGGLSNKDANTRIASCGSLQELSELMNLGSRYYKLNLQPHATNSQPTFEFRQHSGTFEYKKVSAWIRLLVLFVENSARLKSSRAFLANKSEKEKLQKMFEWVVKDRYVLDFYNKRADDLDASCCSECTDGGVCTANLATH